MAIAHLPSNGHSQNTSSNDSISAPNTFTPNGDGINDVWVIDNIENYPLAKIEIFDRWGQLVFRTIGYPPSKRWEGRNKGKPLPSATYYFVIDLKDPTIEKQLYTGSLTIVY